MYLLVNLNWSEILSSRPVYTGALKTNVYSITSLIPIFLEWQKAVYWSANGKNLILRQKFCLKSFDPTILNGAQQMILVHIQRTSLVASIKNGIKHFLFSTTATIAQKSLLIHLICILLTNLTVPCLHSSRKIQSPKTLFFIHTSIVLRSLLYVSENKLDTGFLLLVSRGPVYLVHSQE